MPCDLSSPAANFLSWFFICAPASMGMYSSLSIATSKGMPARFMSLMCCFAVSTSPKAAQQHMQQYSSSCLTSSGMSSARKAFSKVL